MKERMAHTDNQRHMEGPADRERQGQSYTPGEALRDRDGVTIHADTDTREKGRNWRYLRRVRDPHPERDRTTGSGQAFLQVLSGAPLEATSATGARRRA